MIFRGQRVRSVDEEVLLIWFIRRGNVFEGIFDVDEGGEAHSRTSKWIEVATEKRTEQTYLDE
jgi:hypothetical protein